MSWTIKRFVSYCWLWSLDFLSTTFFNSIPLVTSGWSLPLGSNEANMWCDVRKEEGKEKKYGCKWNSSQIQYLELDGISTRARSISNILHFWVSRDPGEELWGTGGNTERLVSLDSTTPWSFGQIFSFVVFTKKDNKAYQLKKIVFDPLTHFCLYVEWEV